MEPVSKPTTANAERPDPEVPAKAKRRRFTAAYKLDILEQVEELRRQGEGPGALLRREGLYSSHLCDWRMAAARGTLRALAQKRGRKRDPDAAAKKEMRRLERENERLRRKLEQAELIIEVQKKVSRLLELQDSTEES